MREQPRRAARLGAAVTALLAGLLGVSACDTLLLSGTHLVDCIPGQQACRGTLTLVTCDSSGHFDQGISCEPGTCDQANPGCKGVCTGGEKRCAGETPQGCGMTGQWQSEPICDANQHCLGGSCVVICSPGDLRCLDENTPQLCNQDGEWQDTGVTCAPGGGCDPTIGECTF